MAAYTEARDAAVPAEVAAAWARVLEAWDNDARHDALLRRVAQHGAYAWVAARYRDAKRAAPASPAPFRSYPDHAVDAIADRQLDRVRRAAEATLYASAGGRATPGRVAKGRALAVVVMLVFAAVVGLVFATALRHLPPAVPGQATPAQPARPK